MAPRKRAPAPTGQPSAQHGSDFGVLLSLASVTFIDELHEAMGDYPNFNGPWTGFVLRALDGETMSLRQLADRLQMSSPGALKIVDSMVNDGYLTRVPLPGDKRVRAVQLTARGRTALEAARRFHASFEAALVDAVGASTVAATRRALESLVAHDTKRVPRLYRTRREGVEAEA